jgi:hypothetical protein
LAHCHICLLRSTFIEILACFSRRFARITHGVFEESKPSDHDAALIKRLREVDRNGAVAAAFERRRAEERASPGDADAGSSPYGGLAPAQVDAILNEVGKFLCQKTSGDLEPLEELS